MGPSSSSKQTSELPSTDKLVKRWTLKLAQYREHAPYTVKLVSSRTE